MPLCLVQLLLNSLTFSLPFQHRPASMSLAHAAIIDHASTSSLLSCSSVTLSQIQLVSRWLSTVLARITLLSLGGLTTKHRIPVASSSIRPTSRTTTTSRTSSSLTNLSHSSVRPAGLDVRMQLVSFGARSVSIPVETRYLSTRARRVFACRCSALNSVYRPIRSHQKSVLPAP